MKPEDMRVLRARLDWSQERLADELDRSAWSIIQYERGYSRIPGVVALACAAIEAGVRLPRRAA